MLTTPTDSPMVIWAVDAFPDDSELQKKTALALKPLAQDARVLPVYILTPETLNWNGERSAGAWSAHYKPIAEEALEAQLENIPFTCALRPTVVVQSNPSRRKSSQTLLRLADKLDADLIAVSTHGRSGMERLFVGSFTETLLHQIRRPLLVVNPHNPPVDRYANVVFATDFTDSCRKAFERMVPMARALQARLHVFHSVGLPYDSAVNTTGFAMGAWIPVGDFLNREEESRRKEAEAWAERARKAGVETQIALTGPERSPADAILRYVHAQSSPLLVMTSQSTAWTSALLGSATRDVIRHSPCPVLVMPPSPEAH